MIAQSKADNKNPKGFEQRFARASSGRRDELELLIEALTGFDPKSSNQEEFTQLFQKAVRSLELADEQLADLLETTRTTISRWINGKNAPSRLARKSVFTILLREARRKLKRRTVLATKAAA